MFDERFARQYRYELPPEFPLASPYTGIVHHLSGPRGRAHTQTFRQRLLVGRCCCLRLASLTFITRVGFSTSTLARTLDSLVRVSRRVGKDHFDRIARSNLKRSRYRIQRDVHRSKPVPKILCIHSTSSGLTRQYYLSASTCVYSPKFVQQQSFGRKHRTSL